MDLKKYWRAAKERYNILRTIRDSIRLMFVTNSAFWLERSLTEDLPETKAQISIEFNFTTTAETMTGIKSFK